MSKTEFKHPMCGECFWEKDGHCHKNPPQVIHKAWVSLDSEVYHSPDGEILTVFPSVSRTDWCGQFDSL